MIKRLETFQEECYQNINLSNIQEKIKAVEAEIAKNQEKLDAWTKELNLLLYDEAKWNDIKNKADFLNLHLRNNFDELKMNLLKDEFWVFENNLNELKTFERFYCILMH
jgi:hypothetical protein